MPTLFKLLTVLALLGGLVYGAMVVLVMMVEPRTGEISIRIPIEGVAGSAGQ